MVGALLAGFVFYLAVQGKLGTYLGYLIGRGGSSSSATSGSSSGSTLNSIMQGVNGATGTGVGSGATSGGAIGGESMASGSDVSQYATIAAALA